MNTEVLKWQRFFIAAGIPGTIASKYSKSFAEQRVQFMMLDDLDKSTLIDLGVVTVGDQIAILRHIRKMRASQGAPVDCNMSGAELNSKTKEKKATSTAPDRDDIYHIHLPAGTTPKTRAILQKHSMLKSAGLLKRGSSGIRQSGRDIVPSTKQNDGPRQSRSGSSTSSMTNNTASAEVSSTTDEFYGRLGVKGLVSDHLTSQNPTYRINSVKTWPKTLFERAIDESTMDCETEPVFRVRISGTEERAWRSRNGANNRARPKLNRVIRKQIAENVPRARNGPPLKVMTIRTFGTGRPSVFDRLS